MDMTEGLEITDAERGLESAPQERKMPRAGAHTDAIEKKKHLLSQAEKRIEEIEASNAKPGWKLTHAVIDDLYFHFEAADPSHYDNFDLSVGAIITWELIEKDMDQGINYSSSRNDYVLGDLLTPGMPKERKTPVKTTKTIRWRNKEIAKELKRELDKLAEQQLRGEDEEKSQEKIAQLRDEINENNDLLIERAETDGDFEEAMSNIATDQHLGGDDEGEQFRDLGRQYEKKRDWTREAQEKRPDSTVDKLRHVRNVAKEQALGVGDEQVEIETGGLSEEDKAIIRDNARKFAQQKAPPGSRLASVDVQIIDLSQGNQLVHAATLIEVEVTAYYEGGMNEQGLPATETKSWSFNPNVLLRYPGRERRPVGPPPRKY